MTRTQLRGTLFGAFMLVIIGANLLTAKAGGLWWPGVTAGTYLAGFAFVARDYLNEAARPNAAPWLVGAIVAGAVVSAAFDPGLALASATAFLLSELADWRIYSRLRDAGRTRAQLASNVAGSIVDTVVFLGIAQALALSAFIHLTASATLTQVAVKVGATSVFVLGVRLALPREPLRQLEGNGSHA